MKFTTFLQKIKDLGISFEEVGRNQGLYDRTLQFSYEGNYLGREFMDITGDAEDSYNRIFTEYSKLLPSQEIDLELLSQELFTPIYTLKEFIDVLNNKEELIAPTKNIDNYFVMEGEIYTKEELLQEIEEIRKD